MSELRVSSTRCGSLYDQIMLRVDNESKPGGQGAEYQCAPVKCACIKWAKIICISYPSSHYVWVMHIYIYIYSEPIQFETTSIWLVGGGLVNERNIIMKERTTTTHNWQYIYVQLSVECPFYFCPFSTLSYLLGVLLCLAVTHTHTQKFFELLTFEQNHSLFCSSSQQLLSSSSSSSPITTMGYSLVSTDKQLQ